MTSKQVEFVMGSAMVRDPFHPDRWDYFYHLETGKGKVLKNQITLYFENDRLVNVDKSRYQSSKTLDEAVQKRIDADADLSKQRKVYPSETDAVQGK